METGKQFSNNRIAFYLEYVKIFGEKNGAEDFLKRMEEVSCADYVLNNYEYTNVIEEFLHYLIGYTHCAAPETGLGIVAMRYRDYGKGY